MLPVTSLIAAALLVTSSVQQDKQGVDNNMDHIVKKMEKMSKWGDKMLGQLQNMMGCTAGIPPTEDVMAGLSDNVTSLTSTVQSLVAQVQTLTSDNAALRHDVSAVTSKADDLTVQIKRMKVWLDRKCARDSDCGAAMSVCFKGTCLCQPGYYFSRTNNVCLEMCPYTDLQPTFSQYPKAAIGGYNMRSFASSLEECLVRCAANPRCRTVDYDRTRKDCYLQPATALDVNTATEWAPADSNYDHYQRHCV